VPAVQTVSSVCLFVNPSGQKRRYVWLITADNVQWIFFAAIVNNVAPLCLASLEPHTLVVSSGHWRIKPSGWDGHNGTSPVGPQPLCQFNKGDLEAALQLPQCRGPVSGHRQPGRGQLQLVTSVLQGSDDCSSNNAAFIEWSIHQIPQAYKLCPSRGFPASEPQLQGGRPEPSRFSNLQHAVRTVWCLPYLSIKVQHARSCLCISASVCLVAHPATYVFTNYPMDLG
jgi:hypothetical protein